MAKSKVLLSAIFIASNLYSSEATFTVKLVHQFKKCIDSQRGWFGGNQAEKDVFNPMVSQVPCGRATLDQSEILVTQLEKKEGQVILVTYRQTNKPALNDPALNRQLMTGGKDYTMSDAYSSCTLSSVLSAQSGEQLSVLLCKSTFATLKQFAEMYNATQAH